MCFWMFFKHLDISRQSFPDAMWCSEIKEIKNLTNVSVPSAVYLRPCRYYALINLHKRYSISCGHMKNVWISVLACVVYEQLQGFWILQQVKVSQILPVLDIYRGELCFNRHVRLNCTFARSLTTEQLEGDSNEEPRFLCLDRRNEIPFSPTVKEQLLKTKEPFITSIAIYRSVAAWH